MHLAVQLLAERFHHAGAEAAAFRRLDRRASPFGPGQAEPLLFIVDGPCDLDAAGRDRERAEMAATATVASARAMGFNVAPSKRK